MEHKCPKCGKMTALSPLCECCHRHASPLPEGDIRIELDFCPLTNRVVEKNKYMEISYDEAMGNAVHQVAQKRGVLDCDLSLEYRTDSPRPSKIRLTITGTNDKAYPVWTEQHELRCIWNDKPSPEAKKGDSTYYEGTLQIRFSQKYNKEVLDNGLELLYDILGGKDRLPQIVSSMVEGKDGVDMRFRDKTFLKNVATQLANRVGSQPTGSTSIVGYNFERSKDVNRPTFSVRLPAILPGTLFGFESKIYKTESLGKVIKTTNIETGKSQKFSAKEIDQVDILKKERVQVIALKPKLAVLHPESFQEQVITNEHLLQIEDLKVGQKLQVVTYSDKVLAVP